MTGWIPSESVSAAGRATVGGLFSTCASMRRNQTALTEDERSQTYGELETRSNQLANALRDLDVSSGDRVAILAHNCIEYIEVELAAAKIGAIVAAINWRLGPRELAHCIELAEPHLLIVQSELRQTLGNLDIELPKIVEIGEPYESLIDKAPVEFNGKPPEPEDGLVILYTSGTTGLPKGALISHRAMIARAACFYAELQLAHDCDFIAWAPLFHMASTDHALATLMRGGTVHIVDGYQPGRLADLIEQVSIGWFVMMPGMVGEFAAFCSERDVKPNGITVCGAMADLVPREQIAAAVRALDTPYLNSFGATETGLPPATGRLLPAREAHTNLRKRQSSFCELRLVDPDDNDVPDGTPGEVALRGPTLFSGYWRADETNAHDFRNGWFHMGDVMRRNEDGTLDYVDRVKYLIKSGGENIYPAEIEQVVLCDERIEEAICVRQKDEKWGEVPVLFVVRADDNIDEDTVLAICRAELSSYKRPKRVIFIAEEDLPRSTTGKIQRHELEALLTASC